MAGEIEIKGIKELNREIAKYVQQNEKQAVKALQAAATLIQGESQEVTPQKTGTLVNSAFRDVDRGKLSARVGYTALYAPFVHEMPESNNFTKPDTSSKFLQKAVSNNFFTILNIFVRFSRI